jgi:hypothetical protein
MAASPEAIYGLAGVVVGALITSGVEIWRERRIEVQELRAAVRRLAAECRWAAEALGRTRDAHDWRPFLAQMALAQSMVDSFGILARRAPFHVWETGRRAERQLLLVTEHAKQAEAERDRGSEAVWREEDQKITEKAGGLLGEATLMFEKMHRTGSWDALFMGRRNRFD